MKDRGAIKAALTNIEETHQAYSDFFKLIRELEELAPKLKPTFQNNAAAIEELIGSLHTRVAICKDEKFGKTCYLCVVDVLNR